MTGKESAKVPQTRTCHWTVEDGLEGQREGLLSREQSDKVPAKAKNVVYGNTSDAPPLLSFLFKAQVTRLKFSCFGHLMRRLSSWEKVLMPRKMPCWETRLDIQHCAKGLDSCAKMLQIKNAFRNTSDNYCLFLSMDEMESK